MLPAPSGTALCMAYWGCQTQTDVREQSSKSRSHCHPLSESVPRRPLGRFSGVLLSLQTAKCFPDPGQPCPRPHLSRMHIRYLEYLTYIIALTRNESDMQLFPTL
ncbi:hypothetical protein PYCCODRAFT_802988 [Trametes coccinea BRFM310]|uniref:Uncharacterized protein n=1 Tax=Trametes coccinea (strain BRFM310) TaxID=1353009 RepID=A0A1Y2IEX9_TRAC3|nr:hypothetical protein PYCCODRAFT_802988 [Trametes coccinea BRFM310]